MGARTLRREDRVPIWNPKFETMPRRHVGRLQAERLKKIVAYASERVPFYNKKFAQARMSAADIDSLDDLKRLPFTEKSDLRDHYPFGLFAVPRDQIARIHGSSQSRPPSRSRAAGDKSPVLLSVPFPRSLLP